jgi:hypothetical protein
VEADDTVVGREAEGTAVSDRIWSRISVEDRGLAPRVDVDVSVAVTEAREVGGGRVREVVLGETGAL